VNVNWKGQFSQKGIVKIDASFGVCRSPVITLFMTFVCLFVVWAISAFVRSCIFALVHFCAIPFGCTCRYGFPDLHIWKVPQFAFLRSGTVVSLCFLFSNSTIHYFILLLSIFVTYVKHFGLTLPDVRYPRHFQVPIDIYDDR
jgi:hypothetical protein